MSNKNLSLIVATLVLIKFLAIYYTSFNLFGDEAQYWLWSKSLDFGYFSKPPLLAWFISLHSFIFGDSFVSLKALPTILYFFVSLSFYSLSKNIGLDKKDAVTCSLLFLFIPAVSFSTFILSTDILLLLFWTLSLNELVKIKSSPAFHRFVLLGIMLGLAFLSKYAAVYFFICLALYVVFDKDFRLMFFKNRFNFLISFMCTFLVILPNIIWNLNNGWVTLQHTSDNASLKNIDIDFFRGLVFLVSQVIMLGPLLFIINILNYREIYINEKLKFLLIFSVPIFFIVLIEAIIVRANANWAAPALVSFFLFLYLGVKKYNSILFKLNTFFNLTFCVVFYVLIYSNSPLSIFDRIVGLNKFATNTFKSGRVAKIENYVISDRLLFASFSYELRDSGVKFYMPHQTNTKITNHFKITSPLKKEMRKNFILIGHPSDISYLENSFNVIELSNQSTLKTYKNLGIYEIVFN